jgi:hypothetical protein
LIVGAPVLSQPFPLALLVTPKFVTFADAQAWACAEGAAALVSSLRTDDDTLVGFVNVVSGCCAVTVGGEYCDAYVEVVTETAQDVSANTSTLANASVHRAIALVPRLNIVDIG